MPSQKLFSLRRSSLLCVIFLILFVAAFAQKPQPENPRIINLTKAIEVVEVEKSHNGYRYGYQFSLKNNSDKDIIYLELSSENSGIGSGSKGASREDSLIRSGKIYKEVHSFPVSEVEKYGLTIKMILFSDGTFEGDEKSAAMVLVKSEGSKLQAAKLLPVIEQILNVSDEELPEEFDKLEARLRQMQEPINQLSAIEFLKKKYPTFDEETILELCKKFKDGFNWVNNVAQSHVRETKQQLQKQGESLSTADRIAMLKRALNFIKAHLK